jgi:hypothetical protein
VRVHVCVCLETAIFLEEGCTIFPKTYKLPQKSR